MDGVTYLFQVSGQTWMTLLCTVLIIMIPLLMVMNKIRPGTAIAWILMVSFYKCLELSLPEGKGWSDFFSGALTDSELIGMFTTTLFAVSAITLLGLMLLKNVSEFLDEVVGPDDPPPARNHYSNQPSATILAFPAKNQHNAALNNRQS
ncbi:hypothetical protein [Pseudomonas sp. PLMAX]|uniref:hypothetical protein n=1 Tax=Pseudomonas sp. PLMAX TaxID=2201998 RepID=UPI0038B733B3